LFGQPYGFWLKTPAKDLIALLDSEAVQGVVSQHRPAVRDALEAFRSRLYWLNQVGLGYLPLLRPLRTLSNGEAHRIQLIASIGSELTETLYVLDEPTVGLHARDTKQLTGVLRELCALGNTVVMVEHDPDVMRASDHLIDMGPGSGTQGGTILFEGTFDALMKKSDTQTAKGINETITLKAPPQDSPLGWIEIHNAVGNNLKNLHVRIPHERLTCVTGVSGAGKTSLIVETLYAHFQNALGDLTNEAVLPCDGIEGLRVFKDRIVLVDQSAPSGSIRSNPLTMVKAYDDIRKLFSETPKAQALGLGPGFFSFNSRGGRCETCEGLGYVTVDMQFMADMHMTCHDCNGKRFDRTVLSVDLYGRNIHDVLCMTVDEALAFFKAIPKIKKRLQTLADLGLGYLPIGQSTSTLSGGEAQRLKLAPFLPSSSKKVLTPTLFIFDEPTRGLHMTDLPVLVKALQRLVDAGHTVIVIEHQLSFVARAADWLIDIGPEADKAGGTIAYEGPLAGITLPTLNSPTAVAFRELLNLPEPFTVAITRRPTTKAMRKKVSILTATT
jgi:excinuclease ABC subunit A